jgi:predicted component of type VI protein secretion system
LKDPVSQPVLVRDEPRSRSRRSAAGTSPSWPRPAQAETGANARLVRLAENGQPIPSSAIQITHSELTFGSDPQQAICVLESPSVSPLHARLTSGTDGTYSLADAGSVAGTWVNFAPISTLGAHLEHGDLIQIGRVSFRFELNKPTRLRQPVVEPYKEDLS